MGNILDNVEEQLEEEYHHILKSGLFWEWYPELSGVWEKDRDAFMRSKKRPVPPNQTYTVREQVDIVNAIKPDYYKRAINGAVIDIYDIAHAWNLPPCLFNALKYILRAGKKEGEPKGKDLAKAIESIQRELGYAATH